MATLTVMPERFAAGTTLDYVRSYSDYRPADGWSLKLYLAGPDGAIDANGTYFNGFWNFSIDTTTSAALTPGLYRWVERATRNTGTVVDLASGYVDVGLNLATAGAGAALSKDEKLLALVNTALEGRLPTGLESYQIAGRAISKIPIEELWKLREKLEARVRQMRSGGRLGRQHAITFRPAS